MAVLTVGPIGELSLGRYSCSLQEFEEAFVTAPWAHSSTSRLEIWGEFWTATKLILDATSPTLTSTAWIGGSFLSDKLNPDDIDVLYLLDSTKYDALQSSKRNRLSHLSAKDHMRNTTGLRVEPFTLVTRKIPNIWSGLTSAEKTYLMSRGQWDDFWQRRRTSADKTAPPTMADAEPRRGYVEVAW